MPNDTDHHRELCRASFDAAFYLAKNPDIAELGIDPFEHFMTSGWRERRDPTSDFSIDDYLNLNHDIDDLGVNPFAHWLVSGEREGRQKKIDLGFRYQILKDAPRLERRLELGRLPSVAAGSEPQLLDALAALDSDRLFITVSHDEYVGRVGGVQACLQREALALQADGWSHLHIFPATPTYVTVFETLNPVLGLVVNGEVAGAWPTDQIAMHLALRAQRGAMKRTGFAIHSLLGHNVEAITGILQNAGGRKGYFWLHDQTSLCASYALLRNDVEYCGAPPPDSPACQICIYGLRRQVQMAEHATLFRTFDLSVVAPSQAMLDHWIGKAPYDFLDAVVHPHAVLEERHRLEPSEGRPLRIAFLGFPYHHKGWPIFQQMAEKFADRDYEFLHFAQHTVETPGVVHVPVGGEGVGDDAMLRAVEAYEVDVAMILSICPETFSFTAHEAIAGGAAVVAFSDSCAVAELVRDTGQGAVVSSEAALEELMQSRAVEALARSVRRPPLYDMKFGKLTGDFLRSGR